jgi:hypothetical protein
MTSTLTSQTSQQQALEDQFGLADRVVNPEVLANSVQRFRERGITLPTFEELSNPPKYIAKDKAGDADPQGPDNRNLWRVHWYNDKDGNQVDVPEHVVLPRSSPGSTPHPRPLRQPLPDDHRAQGAGGVRMPRPASRHRSVRPDRAPRDLAEHRQLRPRRRRDQPS